MVQFFLNFFKFPSKSKSAKYLALGLLADAEISLFIDYVKKNGGIEYARQVMVDYRNKALDLLPSTADTTIKDALTAYIDYVIEREK